MNKYKILLLVVFTQLTFGQQIEAQLRSTAQKGQNLIFAAFPIFALGVAWLYKRGKPEAKERMESLVMGGIIASSAFGLAYFFGK